jgi:peroxiredoxin Q/BCP
MTMTIQEGDQVPALIATLSDGRSINLAAPGAPLVLYFYPKDDTSGCTREAQDFTALAPDFAAAGAMVVGVSRDEMKKHDKFIAKYELRVPLASDADGSNQRCVRDVGPEVDVRAQIYGNGAIDLLIDAGGRVVKVWRKIKVPGHAEETLGAVRALESA